MSKIYEALEHARREIRRDPAPAPLEPNHEPLELPPRELPVPEMSTLVPAGFPLEEIDFEQDMINLYLRIDSLMPGISHKTIQFIGSRAGEGTSTIAREFARVCAVKMQKSVLLLDIDRGHPTLRAFGLKPECGLDQMMEGGVSLDRAVVQVEDTSLYLTSLCDDSKLAPKVMESPRIEDLWQVLRARFDLVIFDSPPATASPDGYSVTPKVDGVVLVVEAEKTKWPVIQDVKEKLISHGGNILGIVFNKRRYYIPRWLYNRI